MIEQDISSAELPIGELLEVASTHATNPISMQAAIMIFLVFISFPERRVHTVEAAQQPELYATFDWLNLFSVM